MFLQRLAKWLIITVIVLAGFLLVLLALGYLLKENAASTNQLKAQLEQTAKQQQAKEQAKQQPFQSGLAQLSANEKSQQKIIHEHQACDLDKQCFLIQTHSKAIGCIVAVNTTGAAILLKISAANNNHPSATSACQQVYGQHSTATAQCVNNSCSF